jgi:cellulose synthase operon protein C
MNDYRFWKDWGADLRAPYLFFLITAILATIVGIFHYFTGDEATIQWITSVQLHVTDTSLREFSRMLVTFQIPVNGFLAMEKFDASLPQINFAAASLYLALLGISLVFYLAIASTFRRTIYLGAMVLLMLYLATFNLDLLGIFPGNSQYALILSIVLLAGGSYSFQAFFPDTRFLIRLLVLGALVLSLGLFIFVRSAYAPPITALHIVNYASFGSLIASALFIILVAYENLNALLWINTQAQNSANRFGLWQFLFISLLYLLNLLLLFFRSIGQVRGEIIYIDAFVLLFFSALVGLWGFRQREKHYGWLFHFRPGAAYLYLVLLIITFLNIGYAFATANDPLVAAYNDIIVYTHLAYGTIFLLYLLINFGGLIKQKLRVYKVVYEPKQIPFFVVYTMGSLLLLALMFRANLYILNQATAGYYNYLGDLYKAADNDLLAERFYVEGSIYEHYNVKSNYSLAGLYREQNRPTNEENALKESLRKRPTEKAYVRLANMYSGKENFFEQMYIIQEGLDRFPTNSQLLNNMALLYNRTDVLDSVAYYYDLAQYHSPRNEVIQSNRLSFLLKHGFIEEATPLAKVSSQHLPLRSNSILLKQIRREPVAVQQPSFASQRPLRPEEFALFYHTHLHQITRTDTSVVRQINAYLREAENHLYDEDLTLLKAAIQRYNGQPAEAKATLENLAALSETTAAYYRDVLGLWMLEQDLYPAAATYFEQAKNEGYIHAYLHHAYALALDRRTDEAIAETRKVFESDDPQRVEEAHYLYYLLHLTPEQAITAADSVKIQHLWLDRQGLEEPEIAEIVQAVQAPSLRQHALVLQVQYYLERNNLAEAQQVLDRLAAIPQADSALLSQSNLLQATIWLQNQNFESLQGIGQRYFTPLDAKEIVYYEAVLAEHAGRTEEAKALYDQLVEALPHREEALLAAANFYNKTLQDDMQAYEILRHGVVFNRFSPQLYQAYILQSLSLGFESFARSAMIDLQRLVSPVDYFTFSKEYEEKLEKTRDVDPEWQ